MEYPSVFEVCCIFPKCIAAQFKKSGERARDTTKGFEAQLRQFGQTNPSSSNANREQLMCGLSGMKGLIIYCWQSLLRLQIRPFLMTASQLGFYYFPSQNDHFPSQLFNNMFQQLERHKKKPFETTLSLPLLSPSSLLFSPFPLV